MRRGVVAFDVAGDLPDGATILAAELSLNMSKTRNEETAVSISVHTVQGDWGEGDSHAEGEEGGGAPAAANDATWLHTFFDTAMWSQPGGDFDATPRAATMVSSVGRYQWQSAELTADVNSWYSNPDANFGWLLLGNEVNNSSAKRFDSRDNDTLANWPSLTVTYTITKPVAELYLPIVSH